MNQAQLDFGPQCELDQLEKLKRVAEIHIDFADLYRPMLGAKANLNGSEKNWSPWKSVKEGSYYIGNAWDLVKLYKEYIPGSIKNKNIKSVNDCLIDLEFDRKHMTSGYTDEAYGGQTECFVSKGQGKKYYELLHSDTMKSVVSFLKIVELNIDIPVKRFLESINHILPLALARFEKLMKAIENDNLIEVENCFKNVIDVNFQNSDGISPLHRAVYNGNEDIINFLLKKEAKLVQTTNKGNTPLHIASLKGFNEVVEILLKHISLSELNNFINAKTTSGGTTSLHVASKNGFFEVVKTLLKHGAIYNIKNKEGKTPLDLSQNQQVTKLLKSMEELFKDIQNGNVEAINKLSKIEREEFLAITNARNNQENTLLQVAVTNKNKTIAAKLLKMLTESSDQEVQSIISPEFKLEQLKKLKSAINIHFKFSKLYLPKLTNMSHPNGGEKRNNVCRYLSLKEGSYYLGNVHKVVKVYTDCPPGLIDDTNLDSVSNFLLNLEFDPKHITKGYSDLCVGECFVSKGQGTKYYELLHNESRSVVRSFIEMVKLHIDMPLKKSLETINHRLESGLEIDSDIENLKKTDENTPIYQAVKSESIESVKSLQKNGSKVNQITNKNETLLHIAACNGDSMLVEFSLQSVNHDELNNFINKQTTSDGATPLHIASENGFLDVVKSLLKNGAIYNLKNANGKMPIELSQNQNINKLFKLIEDAFENAKIGNEEIIKKLKKLKHDDYLAVTNARNNKGQTLLQYSVAIANKHTCFMNKLLEC
ncbi:alpha-latrotoxin-Lg1a-like [Episyrphus balteatus]|uniref:alpha-latrotoxin-Lg1a-like n=1 Tax=Episyrphus balteatus TaxID=286459 RepID=UPI0024856BB2|nr:alpha-latrotoxin-Lg1a-like [Episyrphus balteatus]